ncbi:hypothetical protein VNI00_008006 [Paramarasmius palmivorus]|uniref:Arrestin C-terminal-like domain-containing protein n=1 Tax=Paramarasmius palmivorus TaxID=297713 RepID=A0AAW0CZR8_9AGAR
MSPTPPPAIPSPMNATTHHPKTHISLTFPSTIFPASQPITGKLTLESRASQGLGLGVIMVELFGIQQLSSRDHHATNVFLKERRVFQGLGFGASNAVEGPLVGGVERGMGAAEYWTAKKGVSTFLFSLPLPKDAPNAIMFGDGIASVRYLMRASVEVSWKGERKVVVGDRFVDVVEGFDERALRYGEMDGGAGEGAGERGGVVVAENGKIWIQARVVGGVVVSGESACVELQVKNHSSKKNSSLTITLTRHLVLPPTSPSASTPKLELSDTLTSIPFKGPEYVIHPGVEGVASLVFDVPRHARGVGKGGLFEIKCVLGVKMGMGMGSKDITLDIPVPVVHPAALPELPPEEVYYNDYYGAPPVPAPNPYAPPHPPPPPHSYASPQPQPYALPTSPHPYPALPTSPIPYALPYTVDPTQGVVYLPPLSPQPPPPQAHYAPPPPQQGYYDPHAHVNGYYPAPPQPQQPPQQPPPPQVTGLPPIGGVRDVSDVPVTSPTSSEQRKEGERKAPAWVRSPPVDDAPPPPPTLPTTHQTQPQKPSPLSIALPPPVPTSPQSQNQSLGTPLHSPRPVLSPKKSSDRLRSERVEVLERLAAASEGAGVGSNGVEAGVGGNGAREQVDYFGDVEAPAVPSKTTATTKARVRAKPGLDVEPAAPSSPLIPKASPSLPPPSPSYPAKQPPSPLSPSPKQLSPQPKPQPQLNLRPPRESGLDALEKRLLDHVGTRKPEVEGKKDLWSVFGGGAGSGSPGRDQNKDKERRNSYNHSPQPSPKHEPSPRRNSYNHSPQPSPKHEKKEEASSSSPMDIPAPRQAPANESDSLSAISSLTLPDCELLSPPPGVRSGALDLRELDVGLGVGGGGVVGDGSKERRGEKEEEDDSDNKTTKSGKSGKTATGMGTRSRKKRKDKEREKERVRESRESEKKEKKGRRNERVQAWLSGVGAGSGGGDGGVDVDGMDPEPEPEIVDGLPPSRSRDVSPQPSPRPDIPDIPQLTKQKTKPDPRSSGFVPLGTLKPDILQRTPRYQKDSPMACGESLVEDARRVQELWGSPSRLGVNANVSSDVTKDDKKHEKDREEEKKEQEQDNPWKTLLSRRNLMLGAPETKYDVRSARGGKGGQVTAVAKIWARVAEDEEPSSSSPTPKKQEKDVSSPLRKTSVEKDMKKPITRKSFDSSGSGTPKPTAKSSSGSGSTTPPKTKPKPSTASLARPVTSSSSTSPSLASPKLGGAARKDPPPPPPRISHTLPELSTANGHAREREGKGKVELGKGKAVGNLKAIVEGGSSGVGGAVNGVAGAGEKAGVGVGVGQARLRDLIRKYQGGG